ncbi:DUF6531 domain-containing protein [Streptomyces sp. NPDC058430]|uniref:DUF6531 domain-containing protein n=1 Tax=Streptomyces sp. NPDC058430 TaxID=3346495 RepID=UPI00364651F4
MEHKGTDPVDLATGKMFLPQTDVTLPGTLPLPFTRRVESGCHLGRWFGPSWSPTVDQRLEIAGDGRPLPVRPLHPGRDHRRQRRQLQGRPEDYHLNAAARGTAHVRDEVRPAVNR